MIAFIIFGHVFVFGGVYREKDIFFNLIALCQFSYIYYSLEFLVILPFTQNYSTNNSGRTVMMGCRRFSGKVNTALMKDLMVFVI